MSVRFEYQTIIQCDNCNNYYSQYSIPQKQVISDARSLGWKIGKKVLCDDCVKKENNSNKRRIK